jgi:ketosteroid isomerase-like protein
VRARRETLDLIEGYYSTMDAGRLDECDRYFAPDATLRIAHLPEIKGWDMIAAVMRTGLSAPHVAGLAHEVVNVWEEDDGTVIFEVMAHYTLTEGRQVDVPGVVIATISDGRFTSQRIAADLSPIYGAA